MVKLEEVKIQARPIALRCDANTTQVQDEELDKPQEGPIDDEGEWDTDDGTKPSSSMRSALLIVTVISQPLTHPLRIRHRRRRPLRT